MGVRLGLLGDIEVRVDGHLVEVGHARQQCVLAALLADANRAVPVTQLVDRVWGDHAPHRVRETLYNYLSRLRHALALIPEIGLLRRPGGYVLTVDPMAVDLHRFHHLVGRARAIEDDDQALALFEQALGLWRGEAFAGLDTPWAAVLRDTLAQDRFAAELDATDLQLRRGRHGWLLSEIAARAEAHPLDERAAGHMILALYQNGRQAEALDHFAQLRQRLAEDLGIDPGPALQRLHHDILTQAPALTWPIVPAMRTVPAAEVIGPQVIGPEVIGPAVIGPEVIGPQVIGPEPARAAARPDHAADVFVGREAPMQLLADRLAMVRTGRGQTVLVAGEAGIGKTSLLRRFARQAGVPAAWGACPEHVAAPPLWPWERVLQAVRALSPDHAVPAGLSGLLDGDAATDPPDPADPPDQPHQPDVADAAGAALRLFEAIGRYLSAATDGRVLVVVMDDLHWTDRTSLQLLAYLSEFLAASPVLLVASFRPQEVSAALSDTLAALSRSGAERIELTGLDDRETLALAGAIAGFDVVTPTAATALRARTGGNPFFLREVIRLLNQESPDHVNEARVPPPVREVVLRRVNRLPGKTVTLLSMAAIAGQEFDLEVVAEAASFEVDAALEAIDPAVAAGLVVEDDRRLGWFGFAHALVAEALYEATGRWRRTRLHHRIGQITAKVWAGRDERVAEIARHWLLAAELGPATAAKAAAYAAGAARAADARLAHEAAAESWSQSLAAAELAGDSVDQYALLVGRAISLYRSGNPRSGTPVFVRAMEEALGHEESQEPDIVRLVTVAVAALCESNWYPVVGGVDDERLVDVLERALPLLTDPAHRAVLLAFLAAAHYYDDNPQRRVELSDQALAHARPAADNVTLARVLYLRALALFGPDYPNHCLAAVDALLGLAHLPPPMVAAARVLNSWLLATVGRMPEAAGQLEQVVLFGEHVAAPTVRVHLGWARASQLLLAGRWAEADTISRATYDLHSKMSYGVEQGIAQRIRMIQRWEAAFLTDRCADTVGELQAAAATIGTPGLRTMLTVALVEAGRLAEAREILHSLDTGPKDYRWLYTECWCLLAAARLGDVEHAKRLRDRLLPYRHMACAVAVHVVSGSVAYFTGEGALAIGDADAALTDLALAIEAGEAMGAIPWLARAREAQARAQLLKENGLTVSPAQ